MVLTALIEKARSEGRSALTEAESKALLGNQGVPVVEEYVAVSIEEAVEYSSSMGYPVAIKGLGAKLTHKTERGLVKLNVGNAEAVRKACAEIDESAGVDLDGFLLQPMLQGRREFVAGMFRDAQFGPVVMFGLGGVFTEAIGDVVFRIAPFTEAQALQMTEEILSRKLLDNFRGEKAADRGVIARVLLALSRLALECPEIKEIDVNPLLLGLDGSVKAVDALVILGEATAPQVEAAVSEDKRLKRVRETTSALDTMVNPKSVAVVGVPRNMQTGWQGLFGCIKNFGYKGKLYPINPRAEEISGIKAYPALTGLPGPVDLVLLSIPAMAVPDLLRDCITSGNKNVHIFTAGFKETGEEEGLRLQSEIERIAEDGGLQIIGPNCMGLYIPKNRIVTWADASPDSGPVAFVSQSGGHAIDFTRYAGEYGIRFSKVISYGNALMIDSTDLLEYLEGDGETSIIAMYLEGVKDGRKLLELVSRINRKKPVVILKGGLTDSGARAAASHTGSMAGGERIWNAFFKQTGAIKVNTLEEMSDVVSALLYLNPPQGRNVGIIGAGGGVGVAAADIFSRAGLELPPLKEETRKRLREFIPAAGTMVRNPIDAEAAFSDMPMLERTLEILSKESYIDVIVISIHMDWLFDYEAGARVKLLTTYLCESARAHTNGKPMIVCVRRYRREADAKRMEAYVVEQMAEAGIPIYQGMQRAAFAISNLVERREFLKISLMR